MNLLTIKYPNNMEIRYLRRLNSKLFLLPEDKLIDFDNATDGVFREEEFQAYKLDWKEEENLKVLVESEDLSLYDAIFKIKGQRVKWRDANKHNNLEAVQEVRDELSDFFFDYGILKVKLHAVARLKEDERKECFDEKVVELKEKSDAEGLKWPMSVIEAKARLACKEALKEEREAIDDYEYVKEILDRGDQILNSAASKIKLSIKI